MKKRWTDAAWQAACALTLLALFLAPLAGGAVPAAAGREDGVRVLMYHHLLTRTENTRYQGNEIVTYVEDFEEQLKWLSGQGYRSVTLDELEAFLYDGGSVPEKAVLFTFDDGYLSNFVYAYPLLKQYGYTGVIFTVTAKITEEEVTFDPARINMQYRGVMEQCADVFAYASHTHDLHRLTRGGRSALVDATNAERAADLARSLEVVMGIAGGTDSAFSYPYGFADAATRETLRALDIRMAFRATAGRVTRQSDPYDLPRYPVSCRVNMKTFQSYFE